MTSTVRGSGRFCNNIIRNIAVSLIAEKHDLAVEYSYQSDMDALGLRLFSGTHSYPNTSLLTEDNYFQILEGDTLQCNLDPNWNFFQRADTIRLIRSYLHNAKESVMSNNPFAARYAANNDAFVHVRLTDTKNSNPGLLYYLKALSAITFDTLYIATDDFDDAVIKGLNEAYPSAHMLRKSEVETIQFGSTCKHVILSHGSFSATVGLLSYFSDVFYPEHRDGHIWYETSTFDIPDWKVIEYVPRMSFEGVSYRMSDCWFGTVPIPSGPIRYLEIGTFYGANLFSVGRSYAAHPDSRMYCIDPWVDYEDYPEYKGRQKSVYDTFTRNLENSGQKEKITVIRGFSHTEIPKFEDDFFDIVYIDGNHEPEYVLEDAVLAFRKLKVGGYLIFDDYGWGGPDLTQRGIDAFRSAYHKRISNICPVVNTQLFARKTR